MLPVGDFFPLLPRFLTLDQSNSHSTTDAQIHTQTTDFCRHEPTFGGTTAGNRAESEMLGRKDVGHQLAQNGSDWQLPEFGSSGRIRTSTRMKNEATSLN